MTHDLRVFQELGRTVGKAWERADLDERRFPEIATEALAAAQLNERADAESIVRWVTTSPEIPSQDPRGAFGEPPITVYEGHRFYIEVLFWLDGTTSIHQHGFSGSFGVLSGSSIECSYDFTLRRRVSSRLLIGDMHLSETRFLRAGDVQPIEAGEAGAHSLFHLDRPSISVVVRTVNEPDAQPQYRYRVPHLAIDPFAVDAAANRRIRALGALLRTAHPTYVDVAGAAIERSDLETTFGILEDVLSIDGLNGARAKSLLARARTRHGAEVDLLPAVVAEDARQTRLVSLRRTVHEPELRFFLALLLNVPSRSAILDLVRKREPGSDPEALVERWMRQFSGTNTLGVDMDDMTVAMARHMGRGLDLPAIIDELNDEAHKGTYAMSAAQIATRYAHLSSSPLQPLLAP